MLKPILLTVAVLAALATWLLWDDLTADWEVSTVNDDVITCVWSSDTNKTKTMYARPYNAGWLKPGDPCPPTNDK